MSSALHLLHCHCCRRLLSPLRLGDATCRPRSVLRFASSLPSPRTTGDPKYQKHERNPIKYWNTFYKHHQDKFFKDRHYLEKDWGHNFLPSGEKGQASAHRKVVLEVGCGAGNTLFPLLAAFPDVFVHACDFSPLAVELVKEHGAYKSDRVNAFVCDVITDDLCKMIMPASVDVVTMIFMLSAVSPVKMPLALQNVRNVLKPSGTLLFRDYAMGDFAQEKLAKKGQIISNNFCVRGDGTCAFYFSEDSLSTLFERNGFDTVEVSVYCKQIVNHSRKVIMDRRWIRATFCNVGHSDSPQLLHSTSSCWLDG